MYCVRKVTDDLFWIGANDHKTTLFENVHPIPKGVSYNSYVLLDEKTVLFDTIDREGCKQFLENLEYVLDGRALDYVVVHHVEPDHAASLDEVLTRYPNAKVLASPNAFVFLEEYGHKLAGHEKIPVKEGATQSFGKHTIRFISAAMVHWPEVLCSYDETNGVLFAADAFGAFGALDGKLFNDEVRYRAEWIAEIRRYYGNIVGKYGPQVQMLLKKAKALDIKYICPLHGVVWKSYIDVLLDKYDKWSTYTPEEQGVVIAYASMYGNTENVAQVIASKLIDKGVHNVALYDVSHVHPSYLVAEVFRASHLVLASVTYNFGIYPPMKTFIDDLQALNVQNRTVAVVENGTWAPKAGDLILEELGKMKNMTVLGDKVTVAASLNAESHKKIDELVENIAKSL